MGILLGFFPLYAKDLLFIFLSEFFCKNFSPSNIVLDVFFIKIFFPPMEIHIYGLANCLSLTQK